MNKHDALINMILISVTIADVAKATDLHPANMDSTPAGTPMSHW